VCQAFPVRGNSQLITRRYGSPRDGMRSIAFLAKGLACSSVRRLSPGSDIHSRMIFRRIPCSGLMLKILCYKPRLAAAKRCCYEERALAMFQATFSTMCQQLTASSDSFLRVQLPWEPWALGATICARSPRQWGLQEGAAGQELISVKNTLDAAPDRRSTVIELSSTYATGADRRQLT
jgi:hypothetical protein